MAAAAVKTAAVVIPSVIKEIGNILKTDAERRDNFTREVSERVLNQSNGA